MKEKMKGIGTVILMVLAGAILLPCAVIGAVALYEAPIEVRNAAALAIMALCIIGGAVLLIGGKRE